VGRPAVGRRQGSVQLVGALQGAGGEELGDGCGKVSGPASTNTTQPPSSAHQLSNSGGCPGRGGAADLRLGDWVTVISPEVARSYGGIAALTASGAFWQVEEMAGGAVWLQATEVLEAFDAARGLAVFEVLAPCLPGRVIRRPELEDYEHPYAGYGRAGSGPDVLQIDP